MTAMKLIRWHDEPWHIVRGPRFTLCGVQRPRFIETYQGDGSITSVTCKLCRAEYRRRHPDGSRQEAMF